MTSSDNSNLEALVV